MLFAIIAVLLGLFKPVPIVGVSVAVDLEVRAVALDDLRGPGIIGAGRVRLGLEGGDLRSLLVGERRVCTCGGGGS